LMIICSLIILTLPTNTILRAAEETPIGSYSNVRSPTLQVQEVAILKPGITSYSFQAFEPNPLTTYMPTNEIRTASAHSDVPAASNTYLQYTLLNFRSALLMDKKRTRIEIYYRIMMILEGSLHTTYEVAFLSRLNHSTAKRYLDELLAQGFVLKTEQRGRLMFGLTVSGERSLMQLEYAVRLLRALS